MQKKYEEKHESGPVLCRKCIGEIIKDIGTAMKPLMEVYKKAIKGVFKSVPPTLDNND